MGLGNHVWTLLQDWWHFVLLAQGVNPEIIRIAGRWKSLAYQAYIKAFELVASHHLSNLAPNPPIKLVPPLF